MFNYLRKQPVVDSNESPTGNEVVISGMSGRFPESSNVGEFENNLFAGIDMTSIDDRRYQVGIYGLPPRTGKLKDISSFDAEFFRVHPKQVDVTDPQSRLILETTYEAILDAGLNPSELRGTETGVFIAATYTEAGTYNIEFPERITGYTPLGNTPALLANRVSFIYDFRGPSMTIDTACSGSLAALHLAAASIRSGECDRAIVGGVNLILNPNTTYQFKCLGVLNPEGQCRTFDAAANGFVRSETAATIFLERSGVAKRIYSFVVNSRISSDGFKDEGISFPDGKMQNILLHKTYSGANVNPCQVTYVEAHGTGTKVGDPQEANCLADFFCKDRKTPLLVGSVKTNMGHAEPAAALASLVKLLLCMNSERLPANLHFKNPNPNIPALVDGRIRVVDKLTSWQQPTYAAINSFGLGGANGHAILRGHDKPKKLPDTKSLLPKLVFGSGRTKEALELLFDGARQNQKDDEFLALIRDIYAQNIPRHDYRGFVILKDDLSNPTAEIEKTDFKDRQVWLIFSGMGSQWVGMGKDLMALEVFRNSIENSARVLKTVNLDLMNLLDKLKEEDCDNILYSFVTIVATQIALWDLLKHVGVNFHGCIGHSMGELGCAYADETLTAEQTILAAYARGRAVLDSDLPEGLMAAVGLGWEEAQRRCPPDIFPACNNASDLITITGPMTSVKNFVDTLQNENVFAKIVRASNYAFHSKYVSEAGNKYLKSLSGIIKSPLKRSSRWISSSIAEPTSQSNLATYSSADYHANNFLSPVLFYNVLKHVPSDAVVIEIAPHALLQPVLRKSLSSEVAIVSLQDRTHPNNLDYFLSSVGKLYISGLQPIISKLYPPISYPVSRGTPMINSLIAWDHAKKWKTPRFDGDAVESVRVFADFDLSRDSDSYLADHFIDGKFIFPATGYLTMIWKKFADMHGKNFEKFPVVFEEVHFLRATIMPEEDAVKFRISIIYEGGRFEICESEAIVATGRIRACEDSSKEFCSLEKSDGDLDEAKLGEQDIYKELRLRGYEYRGLFRGIETAHCMGYSGVLKWQNNWVAFMDTMLQLTMLNIDTRDLALPISIRSIVIDPVEHLKLVDEKVSARFCPDLNVVLAGGIQIRKMKVGYVPRRQGLQNSPVLERYVFVPYEEDWTSKANVKQAEIDALTGLQQIVYENLNTYKLKLVEIANDVNFKDILLVKSTDAFLKEPNLLCEMQLVSNCVQNEDQINSLKQLNIQLLNKFIGNKNTASHFHLMIAHNMFTVPNSKIPLDNLTSSLSRDGFIILREDANIDVDDNDLQQIGLILVSKQKINEKQYILLKRKEPPSIPEIINITGKNYSWVEDLKSALRRAAGSGNELLIVGQHEPDLGIVGIMNCVRKEKGKTTVRYIFLSDESSRKFALDDPFITKQLEKQLFANVLKNGKWGSYRHLLLREENFHKTVEANDACVKQFTIGDLNTLKWVKQPSFLRRRKLQNIENCCDVYYAALNFRDIMMATGKLSSNEPITGFASFGLEFSGRNLNGRRVMGLVKDLGISTRVIFDQDLQWFVPDYWTLAEAASIPAAYMTSYAALFLFGKLKAGESILIHAGAGAVGIASISLAIHLGCEVFTTVSTKEKRNFLKTMFPDLKEKNIGNSRDISFETMINKETRGKGVDVVLNSLAGELLQASVRCLGRSGRFVEIGKADIFKNTLLGLSAFSNELTFSSVMLEHLPKYNSPMKAVLNRMVSEGIKSGAVRPLPVTSFDYQNIEDGFRFLSRANHIGKVVIKIRIEEPQKVIIPQSKIIKSIRETYFDADKSYVVVGGLGGFGLELINWMVSRDARNLLIVASGKRGITEYQNYCINKWTKTGAKVQVLTKNLCNIDNAVELLEEASKLAPIGGIFNLAVVLNDGLLENLSAENFEVVASPKVQATKNLDLASRKWKDLDYFVVFSSISCGRGNVGQTNYGMANSAMERICEARRSDGLPGLAIQWGAIGDTGIIIEKMGDNDTEVGGTKPQRMMSCLKTLDIFLQQSDAVLASMVLTERKKELSKSSLLEAVANVLGVKDVSSVNQNNTLVDMGMDSLMNTEIQKILERNYNIVLTAAQIRNSTFKELRSMSN